ncbi:50S ribosomal protein L23 [Candidatus Pacearchaeota archaeon]|nr:50S ribosomal protein L23 [Candidatus Pacearchaeota archaeon]
MNKEKTKQIIGEVVYLKPLVTEKAVMMIESQNVLTFKTTKNTPKEKIKKEIEEVLEVKVDSIRTLIRGNAKYAYVRLNKKTLAMDVASKLGII